MTTTTNKGYTLPTVGADFGVWGSELNANFGIIDNNLSGIINVSVAGNTNVTANASQMQNLVQQLSGVLTGNIKYIMPEAGFWIIQNNTTGAFTITVTNSGGGTGVSVPQGDNMMVWSDGTTFYQFSINGPSANISGNLTVGGNETIGGTLSVTGASTLTGNITSSGALSVIDPNGVTGGVAITKTGNNSASLKLTGNSNNNSTPNKWIRSVNGVLDIVNNAYTQEILILSDTGNLSVGGTITGSTITGSQLTSSGNINASGSLGVTGNATVIGSVITNNIVDNGSISVGGNASVTGTIGANGSITSGGGHCRAGLGFSAGDLYSCVNGFDFGRFYGNFSAGFCGYQLFPTGTIVQGGQGTAATGVLFPATFPNAVWSVVAQINGASGPFDGWVVVSGAATNGFSCWGVGIGFTTAPPYNWVDNVFAQGESLGFYWMAIGH